MAAPVGDAQGQRPEAHLPDLLAFTGVDAHRATLDCLAALIALPESIGRHRQRGTNAFDPDAIAYVRHLGFDAGV